MSEKVVFVLGAGASVADVARRAPKYRPPVDQDFFRIARSTHRPGVEQVAAYMRDVYELDVLAPAVDSLEGVMGRLYPDLFNPSLENRATEAFRSLLRLFNARLAETTNNVQATQRRLLYRILTRYLSNGFAPKDITILTFNQDLQVEKILEHLTRARRWSGIAEDLFCFPHLYGGTWQQITSPSKKGSKNLFPHSKLEPDTCLKVLKLHGSLNWYSTHNSPDVSPKAMFNQARALRVTRRRKISPTMSYTGSRKQYTLPVVVPPVNHKSAVLHNSLKDIWSLAEQRLRAADDLVIFGYSCPALDFESSSLLRRAHRARPPNARTAVIDPDGGVASRYISLLEPERLDYYVSASAFLAAGHLGR